MAAPQPEPWLRQTHSDLPVVHRAVRHALEQAGEDIEAWCKPLTPGELELRPHGLPSVAFQMRHIARSLDRLMTYAEGEALSEAQFSALRAESEPSATSSELFAEFEIALGQTMQRLAALQVVDLDTPRGLGRAAIPTTIGSILIHVAEHTQRHVGQAITTAKIAISLRS
jgi:uncharacterized damage-inducible protein DinB